MTIIIKTNLKHDGIITTADIDEIKKEFNIPDDALITFYEYLLEAVNDDAEHYITFSFQR